MKSIILLLSTFIMTVSCRYENTADCHQVLTFVNTTNKHIYIYIYIYLQVLNTLIRKPLNTIQTHY
jgi:hypothetical protein